MDLCAKLKYDTFMDTSYRSSQLTISYWLHVWSKHRHISYAAIALNQFVRRYLIQARLVEYVDHGILTVPEIYVVLQQNQDKQQNALCIIIIQPRHK